MAGWQIVSGGKGCALLVFVVLRTNVQQKDVRERNGFSLPIYSRVWEGAGLLGNDR